MLRQLLLAVACLGLTCAYGYALMWVFGHEAALPMPHWWSGLFPSRVGGVWAWIVLIDTVTLVLVSIPVAALVSRFGGRHARAVALLMTVALFAATVAPTLAEDAGAFARSAHGSHMLVMYGFSQVRFIAVLPLLVWLFRKLPSNNRWRGP